MNTATAITLVAVDCAYPELAAKALARSAAVLPVARTLLLADRDIVHAGVGAAHCADPFAGGVLAVCVEGTRGHHRD
jgi:hypothetical protein